MGGWSNPRKAEWELRWDNAGAELFIGGERFGWDVAWSSWSVGARFLEGPRQGEVEVLGSPSAFPKSGRLHGFRVVRVRQEIIELVSPWSNTGQQTIEGL